mmetsp:Transcript_35818/g.43783  ORF Transcript_35818/g.43783 Transcript_35818/m.43783 type:complete len:85 (-) Transcript_35818:105-359(-)|eukprot:CAMPEP_0170451780 /NCGR_PEP_ID=MMETSP0123-20130129/911_1 /TAXON_ID=182087 /ORGANISM="Favella ehrenbergii, Strain Fehren 1" /LENGTH=84 /DNA_ID=CAMNT_0010713593 /DNA_START=337 /DNA_END=591 /DNA_ORIENTATION=-
MANEVHVTELALSGKGNLASTTSSSNQSAKLKSASTQPGSATKESKSKGARPVSRAAKKLKSQKPNVIKKKRPIGRQMPLINFN